MRIANLGVSVIARLSILVVAVLLIPVEGLADVPPLSKAHAHLDNSKDCSKCHATFEGVQKSKCLSCHKEIKTRLSKGRGYHGKVKKKCQVCHKEHRGRDKSIIRIPARFNHKLTGWPLKGRHSRTKCTECHQSKRPKSKTGTRTYLFSERPDCADCHQDVHGFVKSGLGKRCDRCHNVFGFNVINAKPDFDHNKLADFSLRGQHKSVPCRKCHRDRRKFAPVKHSSCNSCHRSPHGDSFDDFACKDCHQEKSFKRQIFKHKQTGFALVGVHKKTECVACHQKSQWAGVPKSCNMCHKDEDPHGAQFGSTSCGKCHAPTKWKREIFNHNKQSKFRLVGRHLRIACSKCHEREGQSLHFKPVDESCKSCHGDLDPHDGKFGERPCSNCHNPTGWANIRFDHTVTRFTLEGQHADTMCDKCHPGGDTETKQPMECAACHIDMHDGQFGDRKCGECHNMSGFSIEDFDHSKAQFPRDGRHSELECKSCHQGGRFVPIEHRCIDCHRDFHNNQFKHKKDCSNCHTTKWWGSVRKKFNHEKDSRFPRSGQHSALPCNKCHFQDKYRPMDRTCVGCHIDFHKGDKGPDCEDCHNQVDWSVNVGIAHDFGSYKLEGVHDTLPCQRCHVEQKRKLGGLGPECVGCHRDPHLSSFGPMCVDCHSQREWLPSRFRHYETGYRLTGRHRFVACRECHKNNIYGGLPTNCEFCHLEDAARVPLFCPNHMFFNNCEGCHTERGFVPATSANGLCGF